MLSPSAQSGSALLQSTYARRFAGQERRRAQVWDVLARSFLNRWISANDSVLDLGAGYCEFINAVEAKNKFAIDANPSTRIHAAPGVSVVTQDIRDTWNIPDSSLNAVFSSNFLEHLESKSDLLNCLRESRRVLRPKGRLILLGPNIRFAYRHYWDYFDHNLPLSDRSLAEALELNGFATSVVVPRFLPYTMRSSLPSHPVLLRVYLEFPALWSFFGKQFFIVATAL
jgi:SAM-dependent methyltransferase